MAVVRDSSVNVLGYVPPMTQLQSNNRQRKHIVLKSLRQTLHEEIVVVFESWKDLISLTD